MKNTGDLDYSNGGTLEFFFKNGATTTVIDSTSVPTLNAAPGSNYLTATATYDTSNLPTNVWSTTFGARLAGVSGDMGSGNNVAETAVDHDRPPLVKNPQVLDSDVVQRSESVKILASDADDNVDTIDSMSLEVEVSPAGQDTWDASIVTGGDNVLYRDTAQEGREYLATPSMSMSAGMYDIAARTVDLMQSNEPLGHLDDAFELANGRLHGYPRSGPNRDVRHQHKGRHGRSRCGS